MLLLPCKFHVLHRIILSYLIAAGLILSWAAGPAVFSAAAEGLWGLAGMPINQAATDKTSWMGLSAAGGDTLWVWVEDTQVGDFYIYAQRLDLQGQIHWAAAGTVVCNENGLDVGDFKMTRTTDSQTIVVWEDWRSGNPELFAQCLDDHGNRQWANAGVAICTGSNKQNRVAIVPDPDGGAYVAWQDYRNGNTDVYAQRINRDGVIQWASSGVAVCAATGDQDTIQLAVDGSGGCYVLWDDDRSGLALFMQRLNSSNGSGLWGVDGKKIASLGMSPCNHFLAEDGIGGALIKWESSLDIKAQRVDAAGTLLWGEGVEIMQGGEYYDQVAMVPDGSGGAFFTITVLDASFFSDIRTQRIDAAGQRAWGNMGKVVCDVGMYQDALSLIADGSGGYYATWADYRDSLAPQIYVQRLTSQGVAQWIPNGICVTEAPGALPTHYYPVSDRQGGIIVAWSEEDSLSLDDNLFAQRLVRARPRITAAAPGYAARGAVLPGVTLAGSSFLDDRGAVTYIKLTRTGQPDIVASDIQVLSNSQLTCTLDLTNPAVAEGDWFVVLVDSCGQTGTSQSVVFQVVAPQVQSVQWISVPAGHMTTGSVQNVVGQFELSVAIYDYLQGITVSNLGSAVSGTDLSRLSLWHRPHGSALAFDPLLCTRVGHLAASGEKSWTISGLNQAVADQDALYVTADISGGATIGTTCRLALSAGSAQFALGSNVPASDLFNPYGQTIARSVSLQTGLAGVPPVLVVQGQDRVYLTDLNLKNIAGSGISLERLHLVVCDGQGTQQPLGSVFSRVWLEKNQALQAEVTAPFLDSTLTLSAPIVLDPQEAIQFSVWAAIVDAPAIRKFSLGWENGQAVNAGDVLSEPAPGEIYPLMTSMIQVRESALENVFSAFPSPFNPSHHALRIPYYLDRASTVTLTIFTMTQQKVRAWQPVRQEPGFYQFTWDGKNERHYPVKSGAYWVVLDVAAEDGRQERLKTKIGLAR